MVCVLLNNDDSVGLWLSRSLQNAGRTDIKLISAEELVYAHLFRCGIQNGKAFFCLQLNNGFVFSNETVSAVINRIQYLPMQHIERFKEEDREYVKAELNATFVFLFSILPNNIFNETTARGFCGKQRSQLEWLMLAKQCGFEIPETIYQNNELHTFSNGINHSLQSILFFNGRCYETALNNSAQAAACCTSLGKLSGEKIIEIWFKTDGSNVIFERASTQPTFQNLSKDFIDDVNKVL